MTPVSLGDTVYLHVGTSSASTGAATDADSTPSVVVTEDGVALGYAPTVTNVTTGLYVVQVDATAGNGFEAGRRYSLYATATVGGVTGRDSLGEFEVLATDLNTALDAAISSRMATYTQPTGFLAATFPASVASPTNITAGTITTTTNLTNLPSIPANWLTAAGLDASAVTEIQTGLSTLDAAGVRTAVGLAAANLDTQLAALPTAAENATAVLDEIIEGLYTLRQYLRGMGSALMGKVSGMDLNAPVFRNTGDTKDRITATTDASGNRSAVTLDLT